MRLCVSFDRFFYFPVAHEVLKCYTIKKEFIGEQS